MQVMAQLAAAGQSPEQATATVNRLLDQQAYTMAATDVFYLSAGLFIVLIALVWLAQPRRVSAATASASASGAH
jgi:DHA2 family multidrug resistance protein